MKTALALVTLLLVACSAPKRYEATVRGGALELTGDLALKSERVSAGAADLSLGRDFVPEARLESVWDRTHTWIAGIAGTYSDTIPLSAQIEVGNGKVLERGNPIDTDFQFMLLTAGFSYDLLQTEYFDVGLGLAAGVFRYRVRVEDQGTGGAAFRLMYGAFLHEVADLFDSDAMAELADRLVAHGRAWRAASRKLVVAGRVSPIDDADYDDWHAEHGSELDEGLAAASERFHEFADVEERLFGDLATVARELRQSP